jgi:DNA repair protein RecO
MQHKTRGVVLGISPYSDAFSVVHVFTLDFGRISYLLPQKAGKKAKVKPSLFFPFSILEMDVEHLPLREIQRLKDVERTFPLTALNSDLGKISVVFFLSEFLDKILCETQENRPLFAFLEHSVEVLENTDSGIANFHIAFLLQLTRYLGILPNLEHYRQNCYLRFDECRICGFETFSSTFSFVGRDCISRKAEKNEFSKHEFVSLVESQSQLDYRLPARILSTACFRFPAAQITRCVARIILKCLKNNRSSLCADSKFAAKRFVECALPPIGE